MKNEPYAFCIFIGNDHWDQASVFLAKLLPSDCTAARSPSVFPRLARLPILHVPSVAIGFRLKYC